MTGWAQRDAERQEDEREWKHQFYTKMRLYAQMMRLFHMLKKG